MSPWSVYLQRNQLSGKSITLFVLEIIQITKRITYNCVVCKGIKATEIIYIIINDITYTINDTF